MTELITAPDIAVLQPYCTLLSLDVKDVENRDYKTDYRGLIFLHAGKSLEMMRQINPATTTPEGLPCAWEPWINPDSMKGHIDAKLRKHDGLLERIQKHWGSSRGAGYPTGCIIGVAELVDCVQRSESIWFFGPHGWVMKNARPIVPIPHRGHQGFWPNKPITREVEFL